MTAEREILNLMYEYCWLVDQGRYKEIGELFAEADIYFGDTMVYSHDPEGFAHMFDANISYAPDNTPRTIHMCIDPSIIIDEEAGTAKAKHYTVVVQGVPGEFTPQVIVMDTKFDTFKRGEDGKWRFASRKMSSRCAGDISHHQKNVDLAFFGVENTRYMKDIADFVL